MKTTIITTRPIYSGLPQRSIISSDFHDSLILNLLEVSVTIFLFNK